MVSMAVRSKLWYSCTTVHAKKQEDRTSFKVLARYFSLLQLTKFSISRRTYQIITSEVPAVRYKIYYSRSYRKTSTCKVLR